MSTTNAILAIDQGTTSSRAIVFDAGGAVRAVAQREFTQHYPHPGWVEHDVEEIWETTLAVCRQALDEAGPVAGIGITNQRETVVVWDRDSGEAIHRAIVWQDRRTAEHCDALKARGLEDLFCERTGLVLDPYFSGTKIAWLLDNVPGARERADQGRLAFGTVDSLLIWRLTGGRVHATDATNASRTLLFDIHAQAWDEELLALLEVPRSMLPEVRDSAADFGVTDEELLGAALPIAGVAGDQQAATVGQACFRKGMIKSTYGTGCFAVMNTGDTAVRSSNGLLTTVAYRLSGVPTYALEGSIFVAGAAVQWLRDELGVIEHAAQTEALARELDDNAGVYLVPAFVGLGAPHWDPHARGAVTGLTRDAGVAHFARAALESVCYQTRDLAAAMAADSGTGLSAIRVDGGMVGNDWLLQFLADVLDLRVERPTVTETTALGAACLAGMQLGIHDSLESLAGRWRCEAVFEPAMPATERAGLLAGWDDALSRVTSRSRME
jgi:glycerol kinase